MTLRALIFDVDGTLAETEDLHRQAFNDTFASEGLTWNWNRDTYRDLLKTTGGKERMRAHADKHNIAFTAEDAAQLHAIKTRRYADLVDRGGLILRPGIAMLIIKAQAVGLKLAVATTTSPQNVDRLCQSCWGQPANQIFDVIAAGDEVPRKKPAPDVYQLALNRLDLSADQAIAFEDTANGVQSAHAAGIRVVVTPSIYSTGEDFTGADWILPTLLPANWTADLARLLPAA
ncbi:Phosphorylated carbohydrates phosphatase [Thalassovita gelatinovora]|uniref:Phosphorylated carbohydrates phosphatase n=1 Tax=Thalassovita gelatinovora TaxID=53501 RepID=A0A0P1F8H5_THAGE|nr:HAD-IA family hydrolase [Thalassovita gelatinovora]QIZ80400.1 HAD-IA family hydrolase [Thalassovita gelatinovora]CUH64384.1 Phosphorylated carbohydrates phosphatase [Thalassovita gelatinovora]SEQ92448.1 haloacid dehalogenase superfamily, subfamily IA, variant 3 with third motif having DD or ED [Thalassovita gelatinovora]